MNGTMEALARFDAFLQKLAVPARLSARCAVAEALARLGAPEQAAAEPSDDLLDACRRRLIDAQHDGAAYETRDLKLLPWLLWTGELPFAEEKHWLDTVRTQALRRRAVFQALLDAWFSAFDASQATVRIAGETLRECTARSDDARMKVWREAAKTINLFDPERGPAELAQRLAVGPGTVPEVLTAVGLNDPLRAIGGFARAVQHALLAALSSRLGAARDCTLMARAEAWLAGNGPLRFPDERAAMAQALLRPFAHGQAQPPAELEDAIFRFLLRHMGDPRLNRALWDLVGEVESALMRHWLVRRSLGTFFELLRKSALDEHWSYRERFWSACLAQCSQQGIAFDAWLALGPMAQRDARAVAGLHGSFGRLNPPGAQQDQSVIIMQIGDIILNEWSHNGKLRAWPKAWANAPRLLQADYEGQAFRTRGLPFEALPGTTQTKAQDGLGHHGSKTSTWQARAAEFLKRNTRLRLDSADWQTGVRR